MENISVLRLCSTGTIFQIIDAEIDVQQSQIVAFEFQNLKKMRFHRSNAISISIIYEQP